MAGSLSMILSNSANNNLFLSVSHCSMDVPTGRGRRSSCARTFLKRINPREGILPAKQVVTKYVASSTSQCGRRRRRKRPSDMVVGYYEYVGDDVTSLQLLYLIWQTGCLPHGVILSFALRRIAQPGGRERWVS